MKLTFWITLILLISFLIGLPLSILCILLEIIRDFFEFLEMVTKDFKEFLYKWCMKKLNSLK